MLNNFKSGIYLIKESFRVFFHYPVFIVPLLISWLFYAPILLAIKFWVPWESLSFHIEITVVILVIFVFTSLLSYSCSVLLELVRQLETDNKTDIDKALGKPFGKVMLNILPVVLIWTIIWFLLLILQALLSRKRDSSEREEYTAENAAKTLAGYEKFSFSKALIEAIQKGIRMIVFLILPAIVWENLNFKQAITKGLAVFKAHMPEFTAGFLLTSGAQFILYFPLAIIFEIVDTEKIVVLDTFWYLMIAYLAFAWSYSMYLEQMFTAQLYMWHLKWEQEVAKAKANNAPLPTLNAIPKPSLLDNSPYLKQQLSK